MNRHGYKEGVTNLKLVYSFAVKLSFNGNEFLLRYSLCFLLRNWLAEETNISKTAILAQLVPQ